jgi:hypothetical protein
MKQPPVATKSEANMRSMINYRKICARATLAIFGVSVPMMLHGQAVEAPRFSIAVQQDHDKLGKAVDTVSIQFKNLSDQNVGFIHERGDVRGQQRFHIKLKASDGTEMVRRVDALRPPSPPDTNPHKIRDIRITMSAEGETVKPGETLVRVVDLDEVFMVPKGGDFTLEVTRWDGSSKSYIAATPIHVQLHGSSCVTAYALCPDSTH